MTGFSKDNLLMMKRVYMFYRCDICQANESVAQPMSELTKSYPQFVEQLVQRLQFHVNQQDTKMEQVVPVLALMPWGHHTLLLKKVKDIKQALFYLDKIVENSWNRSVLEYQIEQPGIRRQCRPIGGI